MLVSRERLESIKQQFFLLATDIGLNPAARAMGLKPATARKWASRNGVSVKNKAMPHTEVHALIPHSGTAAGSQVATAISVKQDLLAKMSDRTKLAMSRTAMRAFEHADTIQDSALLSLPAAVALEKHSKVAQLAHGWRNESTNVAVQVNVPLPSDAERAELASRHARLDAIAAKLQS